MGEALVDTGESFGMAMRFKLGCGVGEGGSVGEVMLVHGGI